MFVSSVSPPAAMAPCANVGVQGMPTRLWPSGTTSARPSSTTGIVPSTPLNARLMLLENCSLLDPARDTAMYETFALPLNYWFHSIFQCQLSGKWHRRTSPCLLCNTPFDSFGSFLHDFSSKPVKSVLVNPNSVSVLAAVLGHAPINGLHLDDGSLGTSCPKPGGFSGGWRRQNEAEDVGPGGHQTGTSESLPEHR